MLNSYAETSESSAQYKFVESTLSAVDRSKTPWVFVLFHCPFYNSDKDHQGEKQQIAMKKSMEPLFVKYRVNAAFSGHVHAYERSNNVAFEKYDSKAPIYIIVGDGGNREGHARGYVHHHSPDWSMFRDNTIFGFATLELLNNTHASFDWQRNVDGGGLFAVHDSHVIENQFFL